MIMRAAEKLFTSRRFHEITLDDIVREAHVGKGTVYAHFKDKDDLFFQVAMSGFEDLCDLLRRRVAGEATLSEQLRQVCEAISAFFTRRKPLFRMIQSEDARMSMCHGSIREQWKKKRRQLASVLGQVMQRGQDDGKLRYDMPAERMANLLLGLLRTRARSIREDEDHMSDELLVDFFLKGAGSAESSAPGAIRRSSTERETKA
jgi:AcrR family transcriptional regulator